MKNRQKLTFFSLVLLLLLPLVALWCSIHESGTVHTRYRAEEARLMTGGDDPLRPHRVLIPGETLNINSAGVEALMALPGIDRVLAERIVEQRETAGPYEHIEDIMDVYGIGQGRFDGMKDYIRTGDVE